jgi:hypothetical protein
MVPEGSLLHSQQLATCPCPEPDESRSRSPSRFLKIHFNTILFTPSSCRWLPSLWCVFLSVSCILPKVCPGAICTFRCVPCSAVSSISLCGQWVMKLQGIAEINKLKVTDVLLFRERHSCVCSTIYRVPGTMYRVPLFQLSVASTV